MSFAQSVRPLVPLVIGLLIGGVGVTLFQQSMPGAEGSAEERANKLEVELKSARNRVATLEAADPHGRRRPGRTFADGARRLGETIREGKPVSPDDIFRATQPLMRDLSPLLDRMRIRQQKQIIDSKVGELARKYDLTPAQQASLKKWFEQKAEEESKRFNDLVQQDGTRLQDLMGASMDARPDDGLDGFMATTLSGEKLAAFQTERMTERTNRVQQEADRRVQRLDNIVTLDDAQRDQVFGIMARNSKDYDPAMGLEGVGGAIGETSGANSREAVLSVLRPEQQAAYEADRQNRLDNARKDMEAIGLTLPPDWEIPDQDGF
jgi:hypothetical protein